MTFTEAATTVERGAREERIAFYVELLRGRSQLAEELAYCAPRGISHSTFLLWPDEDQDKAIAWHRLQSAACSRCGTFSDEWIQPDGRTVPDAPYEAVPVRCHGCAEIDAVNRELNAAKADTDGVTVRLRRPTDDEEG